MRRVGMSQSEIAVALQQVNRDRCAPPLSPQAVERVAASLARYVPDQIAVALAECRDILPAAKQTLLLTAKQNQTKIMPMPLSGHDPGDLDQAGRSAAIVVSTRRRGRAPAGEIHRIKMGRGDDQLPIRPLASPLGNHIEA